MTDDQIYDGALKGNDEALQELYASTRDHVVHCCALFLAGDEALPKAVVGTYHRAFSQIARLERPELPPKAWLGTLAVLECWNQTAPLRRESMDQWRALEELAIKIPTMLEISEDSQERVRFMIQGSLDSVAEDPRRILILRDLEGQSFIELAKKLGTSWGAALRRLIRARQIVARSVKDHYGL